MIHNASTVKAEQIQPAPEYEGEPVRYVKLPHAIDRYGSAFKIVRFDGDARTTILGGLTGSVADLVLRALRVDLMLTTAKPYSHVDEGGAHSQRVKMQTLDGEGDYRSIGAFVQALKSGAAG